MKDAKGHGSNAGWSKYGSGGIKARYEQLHGRKDALVRTEPHGDKGHLWQHGNEYGYSSTVGGARREVEDRYAKSELAKGSQKSGDVPTHDGTVGRHGYNPESVDKAINSASRYQGKVSGKERSAIHRLLRGRG